MRRYHNSLTLMIFVSAALQAGKQRFHVARALSSSTATTRTRHPPITSDAVLTSSTLSASEAKLKFDELDSIARASVVKQRGSLSYLKAWRTWCATAIELIQHDLMTTTLVHHQVDRDALTKLGTSLGQAADVGVMPSFEDEGALAGYTLEYFCRAQLVADLIFERQDPDYLLDSVNELLNTTSSRPSKITSLGGGPGFDFVALALIASFSANHHESWREPCFVANVLDYEPRWGPFCDSMVESVKNVLGNTCHQVSFDRCDITRSLLDPANAVLSSRDEVATTDVWICSYCVAENAIRLRESEFCFFREIFDQSSERSTFIFTETTHRLWPEIVDVALETCGFQICFPRRNGRGKSGRQLILHKKEGVAKLDPTEQSQRRYFERDNAYHVRKLEKGFFRQTKKIRGSKQSSASS